MSKRARDSDHDFITTTTTATAAITNALNTERVKTINKQKQNKSSLIAFSIKDRIFIEQKLRRISFVRAR